MQQISELNVDTTINELLNSELGERFKVCVNSRN